MKTEAGNPGNPQAGENQSQIIVKISRFSNAKIKLQVYAYESNFFLTRIQSVNNGNSRCVIRPSKKKKSKS